MAITSANLQRVRRRFLPPMHAGMSTHDDMRCNSIRPPSQHFFPPPQETLIHHPISSRMASCCAESSILMASTAGAVGDDAVGQREGTGGGTPPPPPEQGLRCPRCDSPNTKLCYYNNYSLSQPRHFCKRCRRYWTKGGALRNVPVGGSCRKNKRSRSAAASSRLALNLLVESISTAADPAAASGRLGFLGGAAVDFQGAVGMLPLPRLHSPVVSQYMPFGEWPSGAPGDITGACNGGAMNGGQGAVSSTIASSIESLSFINQDLTGSCSSSGSLLCSSARIVPLPTSTAAAA